MSMETWLEEFYPVGYEHVYTTWEEALELCFLKWEGLKPENLKKHELTTCGKDFCSVTGDIVHTTDSGFGSGMCGLCKLSESLTKASEDEMCTVCPLAVSRFGYSCDEATDEEFDLYEDNTPWGMMYTFKNPEPMIEALMTAKIFMRENVFNKETMEWEPKCHK